MLLETPYFAVDLPAEYEVSESDGYWSALHGGDLREISISAMGFPADKPVDEILAGLGEARLEVLRDKAGAKEIKPVALATRGDARMATFLARGPEPLFSFCANVTHLDAFLDQRCVVTLCVYQHVSPGAARPSAEAFEDFCRGVVATLQVVPQRAAIERSATAGDVGEARLFPYLVPAGYLESRAPDLPRPRCIGHGIHVALAEDFEGAARIHWLEDLGAIAPPPQLFRTAQQNLVRALGERKVTIRGFQGPRGLMVMVFGPEWLAASCLLLPDFHMFVAQHLGDGPLCASIPHLHAMHVFRREDDAYLREMRALIEEYESEGPKRLTPELFSIGSAGVEPLV